MADQSRYYIRCRKSSQQRSQLLTPDGKLTRKRVHAARVKAEHLKECLEELRALNDGWTFEAVPIK